MMKKITLLLLTALYAAWCCSCATPSGKAETAVRDCDGEYQALLDTAFNSTAAALGETDNYLYHFGNSDCEHLPDVRQMKAYFEQMDLFFHNRQFGSYHEYMELAHTAEKTFMNSGYRSVRLTWQGLHEEKRAEMLRQALDDLTAESFMAKMRLSAEDIVRNEICGNGPLAWKVFSSDIFVLGHPTPLDSLPGKECNAYVRVHIKGPLGWRKGSVKLQLTARLAYDGSGQLQYSLVDYTECDRSGRMPLL